MRQKKKLIIFFVGKTQIKKKNKNKMEEKFLNDYSKFVESVTSKESNNFDSLIERLHDLNKQDEKVNISLLLTSALGLSAEAGEFTEVVKKLFFNPNHLQKTINSI